MDEKELKNIILCGKQYVSVINLFNVLLNLYEFIVYKLIPTTLNNANQEEERLNIEMEISDVLNLGILIKMRQDHSISLFFKF